MFGWCKGMKKIICVFSNLEMAVYWFDSIKRHFDENNIIEGSFKRKNLEILFEDRYIRFVSSYMEENQWLPGNRDAKILYFSERRFEDDFKETLDEILWKD